MSPPPDDSDRQRERQDAPLPVSNTVRAAFALGLFALIAFIILASFAYEHYAANATVIGALITGLIGLLATGRL